MSARHSISQSSGAAKQIFLLGLPYLLTFFALLCFSFVGVSLVRQAVDNSVFSVLFRMPDLCDPAEPPPDIMPPNNTVSPDTLPRMVWGDRFATLSVDEFPHASIQDAPVYVGDDADILKKGVGKFYGSRFCGEGGKIVLSAHCNKEFYCLEDMQVGNTVRLHTIYGEYVYRVREIVIFEENDVHMILDETDSEQLLLYTCYPRGLSYRRQRIGILCDKISGVDFR